MVTSFFPAVLNTPPTASKNFEIAGFPLSLETLVPHLLKESISEGEIVEGIEQLSHTFTRDRESVEEAYLTDLQVSAYSSFYFPTNFPKLHYLLDRLPLQVLQELGSAVLIDWGTGPGTFAFSWCQYWSQKGQTWNQSGPRVFAIDRASSMIKQANKFLSAFPQPIKFSTDKDIPWGPIKEASKKALLFGHSFNEMTGSQAYELIAKVDPSFIIFIEPGTKEVFKKLLPLRNKLLSDNFKCHFPCAHSVQVQNEKSCHLQGGDDWCHQIMVSSHHPDIERLSQRLRLDRRSQPLIAHFYEKRERQHEAADSLKDNIKVARLVRTFPPNKVGVEMTVCDSNQQLINLEFLAREFKGEEGRRKEKIILSLRAGDLIQYKVLKQLPNKVPGKLNSAEDPITTQHGHQSWRATFIASE